MSNDDEFWEAVRAARPAPQDEPVPQALMERIAEATRPSSG